METQKPIHTLVLDTGSIIKNEPPVSTLLKQSETLITVPEILQEIKDAATRSRVETTLRPFLTLRSPNPTSIKFVADFARRTGDLVVLSRPDILIIALAYELECERNGGDWRLRRTPGQKRINGSPPQKEVSATGVDPIPASEHAAQMDAQEEPREQPSSQEADPTPVEIAENRKDEATADSEDITAVSNTATPGDSNVEAITDALQESNIEKTPAEFADAQNEKVDSVQNSSESQQDSDSDSDGWITPGNIKKKQAEEGSGKAAEEASELRTMQVGVLTTDFAMQNVILQINLNLLSPTLTRVKHLKNFILRCHACFQTTKEMSKQFCPRCGQPSLTRVACSTNANGEFKLHLKKNMQWNNRGARYSIPKLVHGSSNGRVQGGGKGSWGNDLILAEDQKEYQRAVVNEKRQKATDLMDQDYLPGILTGDRGRAGGRIKVGAGRNVNSKKR